MTDSTSRAAVVCESQKNFLVIPQCEIIVENFKGVCSLQRNGRGFKIVLGLLCVTEYDNTALSIRRLNFQYFSNLFQFCWFCSSEIRGNKEHKTVSKILHWRESKQQVKLPTKTFEVSLRTHMVPPLYHH